METLVADADLDEDAGARQLVFGGGLAVWSDATGHFDLWDDATGHVWSDATGHYDIWSDASGHFDIGGAHVGAGDTHCFAVDAGVIDAFAPEKVLNVQLGAGELGAIGMRAETVGASAWAGSGAEAYVACEAWGDDGGLASVTVLAARGLDTVLALPRRVGGRLGLHGSTPTTASCSAARPGHPTTSTDLPSR